MIHYHRDNHGYIMKLICKKILMIAMIALFSGIGVNQFNPNGIGYKTLYRTTLCMFRPPVPEITADSAFVYFLQDKAQFVDIRPREAFEAEHLPAAISKPYDLQRSSFSLPASDNETFIFYGYKTDSSKSALFAKLFQQETRQPVFTLKGGILSWIAMEFPLEMRMDP